MECSPLVMCLSSLTHSVQFFQVLSHPRVNPFRRGEALPFITFLIVHLRAIFDGIIRHVLRQIEPQPRPVLSITWMMWRSIQILEQRFNDEFTQNHSRSVVVVCATPSHAHSMHHDLISVLCPAGHKFLFFANHHNRGGKPIGDGECRGTFGN